MIRLAAKALVIGLVVVVTCLGPTVDGTEPSEQAVKAAFLFNFAKFVEWPADSVSNQACDSVFAIGVLGSSPITLELNRTVTGKTIRSKRMQIKTSTLVSDLKKCQVVFLGDLGIEDEKTVLDSLRTKPILTVGESPTFGDHGGIIRFFISDRRVRFNVSASAAAKAGLTVSAQLLRLSTPSPERAGK